MSKRDRNTLGKKKPPRLKRKVDRTPNPSTGWVWQRTTPREEKKADD